METILDTFPAFLAYWKEFRNRNQEDQIDGWRYIYMADWPELLNKQIDEYESEGVRWRDIAGKNVFPELEQRFPDMQTAYSNLLDVLPTTLTKAIQVLEYEGDLAVVIYVGIGLGAGWATTYAGLPAILLGLENIAECGWISKEALIGLIAHELGHVVHFWRREQANVAKGNGPWWQLYSEGVAMRSEHLVMGAESWHMRERDGGDDWLGWCESHRSWLATEFLDAVDSEQSVRPFFGSWYDLQGYRQTGYYLGHELVRVLEADLPQAEIALFADDDPRLRSGLTKLATEAVS